MSRLMKKFSVAVLLSGGAQFSPYYGGALARWTYEVCSRLQGQIDTTVFGVPTRPRDCIHSTRIERLVAGLLGDGAGPVASTI
jgi:hypothetical protein